MESDQNTFDQSKPKWRYLYKYCNNIKYKSKIVHRKYKQLLPYLFLREHNLLHG